MSKQSPPLRGRWYCSDPRGHKTDRTWSLIVYSLAEHTSWRPTRGTDKGSTIVSHQWLVHPPVVLATVQTLQLRRGVEYREVQFQTPLDGVTSWPGNEPVQWPAHWLWTYRPQDLQGLDQEEEKTDVERKHTDSAD